MPVVAGGAGGGSGDVCHWVVTVPSVTRGRRTAGIVYTVDPAGPYDGTVDIEVTVTATVLDDYGWGQLPPGGRGSMRRRRRSRSSWSAASCDEVTPAAPTVTQALCRDGVVGDAAVTVGPTDDITYTFSEPPPYSEGQSVTMTATLEARVSGGPATLPAGRELTSDTTAEFVVTFDEVECMPVSPVEPGGGPGDVCGWCGDGAVGDVARRRRGSSTRSIRAGLMTARSTRR